MDRKFLIAATVFAASLPALAGTVMETVATPSHKLAANQTQAPTPAPHAAVKPPRTPNADATGKQAKAVSHDTDRKIAHGQITPQRDPANGQVPGR